MEEFDGHLADRDDIRFLPWIGPQYESGFRNRKLLILGESHYDTWDGKRQQLGRCFTRECVERLINEGAGLGNFGRNIEQALLGQNRENGHVSGGGGDFWNRVAFYNFVQNPVRGGARVPPPAADFVAAREPFRALIEELRPDRIIVCGRRLWSQMESTPYEAGDADGQEFYRCGYVQAYRLSGGSPAWCLAMTHPSAAFSWQMWHPIIRAFLDDPTEAAELLLGRERQREFAERLLRCAVEQLGDRWHSVVGNDPPFNRRDAWIGLYKKSWGTAPERVCIGLSTERSDWTSVSVHVSVPEEMAEVYAQVQHAIQQSTIQQILSAAPNGFSPAWGPIPCEDPDLSVFASWLTPEFMQVAFAPEGDQNAQKKFGELVDLLVRTAKAVEGLLDGAAQGGLLA